MPDGFYEYCLSSLIELNLVNNSLVTFKIHLNQQNIIKIIYRRIRNYLIKTEKVCF